MKRRCTIIYPIDLSVRREVTSRFIHTFNQACRTLLCASPPQKLFPLLAIHSAHGLDEELQVGTLGPTGYYHMRPSKLN